MYLNILILLTNLDTINNYIMNCALTGKKNYNFFNEYVQYMIKCYPSLKLKNNYNSLELIDVLQTITCERLKSVYNTISPETQKECYSIIGKIKVFIRENTTNRLESAYDKIKIINIQKLDTYIYSLCN